MVRLKLSPAGVARTLSWIAAVLVLLSVVTLVVRGFSEPPYGYNYPYLLNLFNLDGERNVPTLFSSLLLMFGAVLAGIIAFLQRTNDGQYAFHWMLLSIGLIYMAVDETVMLHERLIPVVRNLVGDALPKVFYFAWTIPGVVIVLLLAVYFANFLRHLPSGVRRLFLLSGGVYLAGVLGLEMLGGWYAGTFGNEQLTYAVLTHLEEGLEMAGLIIFTYAALKFISLTYGDIVVQLGQPGYGPDR